ncbi:MAG TPA: HlyD family efflux transporter periplasmic adaptor subunit [Kofleriaceae bacterium]|nr:HlyD family efflux transporter periplasmic adaptor subunit [Kofleriaceae bacterium]
MASSPRAVRQAPPPTEFVGVVTSRKSSVITAQVQAPLLKLNVHAGQLVKAGELVARLDETELKTRLDTATSNEKAARMEAGAYGASASAAHDSLVAEGRLAKYGVSSRVAFNNARSELARINATGAAASARAMSARAEREQAEKNLAKAQVFSPLDGIVTNIKAQEGQVTQIGSPLARVFDPSDLIIRFAVPREHRGEVRVGQRVELAVEGDQGKVWATVTNVSGAQEPPINFTVVEADIDDTKLAKGAITVASVGRVRIADARGAKR